MQHLSEQDDIANEAMQQAIKETAFDVSIIGYIALLVFSIFNVLSY